MIERQAIPEGLDEMPPGLRLAGVLSRIDRGRLSGCDLVTVTQARARQVAHEQAELLADLVAVAHCPPSFDDAVVRSESIGEFADEEIRVALTWTRRAADAQLSLALAVVEKLPAVHAALSAGLIDVPRARVLCDGVCSLDEPTARRVIDQIIGAASGLTTGQIRARLQRLVIAVDPEAAKERAAEAVTGRHVESYLDSAGTATLAGVGLPADRAAAAAERLSAIARTAKAGGDGRSLDQLRADTFLELLEGSFAGPLPAPRRGVVELTVPLATLMRLSEAPGELAGWGPVIADIARQVTEAQTDARWRFSVYDALGRLVRHGNTRRRPTAEMAAAVIARDRTCRSPGCRVPASRSDLDHTRDWAKGGETAETNLGSLCRRHHRTKHQGGWRLRQILPGVFAWTTALGHTHLVGPELQPP